MLLERNVRENIYAKIWSSKDLDWDHHYNEIMANSGLEKFKFNIRKITSRM